MTASRANRRVGIVQIALSGACFGSLGWLGKRLFAAGMSAGELLALRFLIAALVLWAWLAWRARGEWRLRPREILACAGLGTLGYALFSSCFFLALEDLSASLAVLLLYLYPLFVIGGARLLWNERVPHSRKAAVPFTLLGLVALVGVDFEISQLKGLALGLASAVFYAAYILASSRWLARLSPTVALTYILSFAGLSLALIHFRDLSRIESLLIENWLTLFALVGIGTIGAMALFLAGLQKLRPWEVSLLSTLEPVTGVLIAVFALGEKLSVAQWAGAATVLTGLAWISLPAGRLQSS